MEKPHIPPQSERKHRNRYSLCNHSKNLLRGFILVIAARRHFPPAVESVADMGGSGIVLTILSALIPLPVFVLGYALARWHTYGMFCSQFNKAVNKGYPQFAEEYKL